MQSRSSDSQLSAGTIAPRRTQFRLRTSWSRVAFAAAILVMVAGCADIHPSIPPSQGHISASQVKPEPERSIPPPARTSSFVPPPKPAAKAQTYTVVVNEVPVKELLLALSRDTKQNIDVHPGLQGLVSLNAINETLPAILNRISKQVNMRYRVEGDAIIVSPDTPYLKTYHVNYVNMTRNSTSTIGVSGQITAGIAGTSAGATTGGGAGQTNASSTVVTTTSNNDFWAVLRQNISAILSSTRARNLSAQEKAAIAEERRAARDQTLKEAEAVARAGQAATNLFTTAFRGQNSRQPDNVQDDIVINPVSGTVSVLATERQHRLIQQHLDSIMAAAQRQVLIEATIVEVSLSDAYQGGIDWSRLAVSGGITFTQTLLGGFNAAAQAAGAAAGNAVAIGYQNPTSRAGNISATVKLLQEFGRTRVLSSPKLMVLNNQTALLKVVDNVVYFEVQAQTSQSQTQTLTTFNTTPKTVSVGVVMGVTPQINSDGRVSLTIRPTISRVLKFVSDPNPNLANPCAPTSSCPQLAVANLVPEIQVREMESVLQVGSGQTVILGGLMQDDVQRNREQLPGADQAGAAGEALRYRDENASKTELVIFLRPTVITNPTLDSDELKFFRRFLPQTENATTDKTGKTQ